VFDAVHISPEALQDLCYYDTREGERFDFVNHPPQFVATFAGRRAEKINPDRSVDQYQERFRRICLMSPFQIPLP
jgi:hypothetical protein